MAKKSFRHPASPFPNFPGARDRLHGSFPDPRRVHGERRQAAFDEVAGAIQERVRRWLVEIEG